MTPKEKAEQLIIKYRLIEFDKTEDTRLLISLKDAKECALIAIDEIINAGKDVDEFADSYWQEVKQEIENL
jgi:hypothetical protein